MSEPEKITGFVKIRWVSSPDKHVENFISSVDNDEDKSYLLNSNFVEKLDHKRSIHTKTMLQLGFIYYSIVIILFISIFNPGYNFSFMGFNFKNVYQSKEVLLLIASIAGIISAFVEAHRVYLGKIISASIDLLFKDGSRNAQILLHNLDWSYLNLKEKDGVYHTGIIKILYLLCFILIIYILLLFMAGAFFVQISIIYEVYSNPISQKYVNWFVVSIAVAAQILSVCLLLMRYPLPVRDYENLSKLDDMKEKDPDLYKKHMRDIGIINEQKRRKFCFLYSGVIFSAVYTFLLIAFGDREQIWNLEYILFAVIGLVVISSISATIILSIVSLTRRIFFKFTSDETAIKYYKFLRLIWAISMISVPSLLSLLYVDILRYQGVFWFAIPDF